MSDTAIERPAGGAPAARRILLMTPRLEPTAPCRAVVGLALELAKAGHEVQLVSRRGSIDRVFPRDPAALTARGLPPIWISRALARNLRGWLSLWGLARRVGELNPDLIHAHGAELAGVGARLARHVRKPYVLAVDDFLDPGQSVARSRRFLQRVLVASKAVRVDLVNRIGLERDLIDIVPSGVDIARYPDRTHRLVEGRVPVVGAIDRLVESKGQEQFIRAAHLLAMRGRSAQFVIAGEGPDRKRLQNLVAELDLVDRVTFARSPVDQLEVLKAIDILVVPALNEALGLPAIEAMASGIPVVAASSGGIFSLIESGKTGVLVPKKSADAIATQIEDLIDDPRRARQLAEAGRAHVAREFNINSVVDRVTTIYENILGDGSTERGNEVAGQ